MRSPGRALSLTCNTVPGNSQTVVVFDSTYGSGLVNQASVNASTGSSLTPGPYRNRYAGAIVGITVKCTTQNVTLLEEVLTGTAGTSSDWEAQGSAGTNTVTAGTTSVLEFKPLAADWRIRVLAGATGPGACTVRIRVVWGEDYGN